MAIAHPPLPSVPPSSSEEEIDPRQFREHHFGLWGAQLLLAAGVVWMAVTGLREVQKRDALRKVAERARERSCGAFPLSRGKGRRILVLALSEDEAKWNTQEGVALEERRGVSLWLQEQLQKSARGAWQVVPSGLWTLSSRPLSHKHQQEVSRSLLLRCGVEAVFSVVLTRWPRGKRAFAKKSKHPQRPRLPKGFSLADAAPQGFLFRTLLMFSHREVFGHTADQKGVSLGKLPAKVVLSSKEEAREVLSKDVPFLRLFEALAWARHLRVAKKMPPDLLAGTLRRICGLLQRGGASLSPFCEVEVRAKGPDLFVAAERIAIPEGEVWKREDGKDKLEKVAAFSIDRDEVDRASYARCVLVGACPLLDHVFVGGWSWPRDRLRVKDAERYCAWQKGKLPTEAQWVMAARGGVELGGEPNPLPKRPYPWGDAKHDCSRANLHWCFQTERNGIKIPALLPLDRFLGDVSPYGVRMMAGNVSEMMRDGLIKGGSSFSEAHTIDWRGRIELRRGLSWVGFRCAGQGKESSL